ncbi:hypothetical protein CONPUDRAFT_137362 [Coniophora puteana RWD-64-598 SS2]|uniref:Aminoglycoside phosphotransferase domain-containing protein n=1 Tax=Coniophora puteana (strain RWD-64-598) TaxID=741705 RepID=A0A5M3MQD5_CONPW|nr:uncharacterized protein CONPUDRAFT_137362 [Coniophora puteana RWD-64-598 SS2]EIW81392.1 hypothetical protein CONPUDRAFT_137362 [Coniophora puteana RWD-64-598 SS2]
MTPLHQDPLPCPPISPPSSTLTSSLCFFIHEWVLKPLSNWYCEIRGIPRQFAVFPLPFGLILKSCPNLREQEGLAMNLARAMGVPAPKFISYGDPPPSYRDTAFPSLLMTRLPGKVLDQSGGNVGLEGVKEDLVRILTLMRRFESPWGDAVCGIDGGPVYGPLVPAGPLPPSADEAEFYKAFKCYVDFASKDASSQDAHAAAERFFALPRHAIVFTHGDLNSHNILVNANGRITGIVDWEAAAWLPDYWEVSIAAVYSRRPWSAFMSEGVTSGAYAEEVKGYRGVFQLTADTLSIG